MRSFIRRTSVALLLGLIAVSAGPIDYSAHSANGTELVGRNVLGALRSSASYIELKFQPVLDFDKDGYYNTAAIDDDGNTNSGGSAFLRCPASGCRSVGV